MVSHIGKVVIGGGSGFIGSALRKTLKSKGYSIIVVSRKPTAWAPAGGLPSEDPDFESVITWNELERSGLPKDTTAVVSIAGQNVLDPTRNWTAGFKQNVWASRVNTTRYLAEAIESSTQKPKVFVTMSGVGYYPPSATQEYTEESGGGNFDFLSNLCRDWEAASRLSPPCSTRTVNVRTGVVLGRDGGMIQQLMIPFYLGVGGPVGSGKQPMPWIHIEDIVGLFIHAIENDQVSGALNGVAPQLISNKEFAQTFASALWRPAIFPLPSFFINWLFSRERAKIMTEGQKVLPKKALETGYQYLYPNIKSASSEFARLFVDGH